MVIERVDDNQPDKSQSTDVSLLMAGLGPSSEDYYPTVVINALLKILKDPSLSQQYQPATQAILNIFQALQLKMVPFLPQVSTAALCFLETSQNVVRSYGVDILTWKFFLDHACVPQHYAVWNTTQPRLLL